MTIDLTTETANLGRIEDTDRIIITGMEYKHLCSKFSEWNDRLKKNSYSNEEFFKELDDSQQDKETLYAKFCNEALDKKRGERLTYPELYAAWNDWVFHSKFTNTCGNISIGIGEKDSRNFVKYVKDFFRADSTHIKIKGKAVRALCNLTTRQASAEKKPVTPIKPVSDWT